MPITSTNFTSLGYIEETVAGATPTTPAMQLLPTTGGSPQSNLSTAVSESIRSDRMTDDLILVDNEVAGSINYEMSYTPFKPFLTSLLRNTATAISFSGDITAVNASSEFTTTGSFTVGTNFAVGQLIYLTGFTDTTIDGTYRITSLAAGSLGVYPAPPADETLGAITISGSVVTNGSTLMDTFTFMKRIEGVTNPAYFYYRGCAISSLSMSFETGSILNGTFDIIGRTEEATETPIAGQSIVDTGNYRLMNAVNNVASIDIGGLTANTCFSSMNLTMNNNVTAAKCIGVLGAKDIADFGFDTTADISMYFEDLVVYNKFINSESFSVTLVLADGDGNRIQLYLPKCKFETLEVPIDGKDNFLMLNGSMRALRDATLDYVMQLSFYTAP